MTQPRTDPITDGRPTPQEDVNALLRVLQGEVTRILSHAFVGMYVSGSLALGNPTAGLQVGAEEVAKELALHGGEGALAHRVVGAVADRAHGAADTRGLAACAEAQRRVLAAVVGVAEGLRSAQRVTSYYC